MTLSRLSALSETLATFGNECALAHCRFVLNRVTLTDMTHVRSKILAAALFLTSVFLVGGSAMAEPRLALVVGNGKYGQEIGSLVNPPNDANLMAERLSSLGFQVTKLVNGDQKAMKRAISEFGQKLSAAGPTAVGLFFYAGHGVQVDGVNYLIPTNAAIATEADVDMEAISADAVLKQMEYAGVGVNIVLLDACRNNPLARSMRSSTRGLARMDAPTGTFIGYSTGPGDVAADGEGKNSPYTAAIAEELGKPGIAIEEAFRNVRVRVMGKTEATQVPWDSSSLTGAFYFQPGVAAKTAASNAEEAFWEDVKGSTDPSEFDAYLARFPDGAHADLARSRASRLRTTPPKVAERSTETAGAEATGSGAATATLMAPSSSHPR